MPNESPDIHPRAPKPPQGAKPARASAKPAPPAPPRKAAGSSYTPDELHVCFNCAGELVYPLDWCEEGLRHWRIVLRCPDCE